MDGMLGSRIGRVLAAALVCTALGACGEESSGPGGSTAFDAERMHEVAADEDATPAEIIEAGMARRLEASGAGQVLVAYLVESDDDEGPQATAWRLYDESGEPVADGPGVRVSEQSALPDLWPLADGFLFSRDYTSPRLERIDAQGEITDVTVERRAVATAAGDVVVPSSIGADARVYRPADDTAHSLELPRGIPTGLALDDRGGVWVLSQEGRDVTVRYSPDAQEPWQELPLDLSARTLPTSIQAVGDQVYVPLATSSMEPDLTGLVVQDVAAPGEWRPVDVAGLETSQWYDPTLQTLPDGRILASDYSVDSYAGRPQDADPGWARIEPPATDDSGHLLRSAGGRLYAIPAVPGSTYVSDDLGETWAELPH